MEWNHCGHLRILINKILARFDLVATERFGSKRPKVWEKMSKIDFQNGGCGGHLGFSREEVIWNYQQFFHTNVLGPYKCIRKQTWPRHKKVKWQCTTIILATLVDLPSPMFVQRFSLKDFFFWLSWGLTTRQPLWVILCRLPEKGRK